MEIFKVISDFPNYEVSNMGNVRNRVSDKILNPGNNGNGYLQVILCKDGNTKKFLIHRLVATVFIPNPENKRTVNHINGIKTDNRIENLEWATQGENIKHAFRMGLNFRTTKQKVRCIETNQEFESILSASKYFGCVSNSIRKSILKGCRCKGYHFELV